MLPKRTLSAKSNLSLLSANSKNSRNTHKSSNSHLSIQECASNLSNLSHLTNLDVTEMKTEISDKVYAKLKAFYKEKQQKLIIENQTLHENYDCYFNTMNKIRGVAAKILKNFGLILDPSVIENSSVNHNTSFPYFMTPDYSMAMVHSQRQVRRVCLWVG